MLRTVRISVLAVPAVLAPALTCPQQAQTATGLKPANRSIIDGVTSPSATPIRVDDIVFTEANNSAQVIGKGNTLVFTPNSNFVAQMNAYVLKAGGSKVASYTGMTARV